MNKSPNTQSSANPNAPYRSSLKAPDPFRIENKQKDRVYRFVSKTLLDKNAGFDQRGWEPITAANHKGEKLVGAFGKVSAGTDLRYGDLVLSFMSKSEAEINRQRIQSTQMHTESAIYGTRDMIREKNLLDEENTEIEIQRVGKSQA